MPDEHTPGVWKRGARKKKQPAARVAVDSPLVVLVEQINALFTSCHRVLLRIPLDRLLEKPNVLDRANALLKHLDKELQLLKLKNDIQSRVRVDMDQQQKEYFLHQQMKEIQNELGENPIQQEINELRANAKEKKWVDKVKKTFLK